MNKNSFLRDAVGQLSMARLALLFANIVMLYSIAIWGMVCLRTNDMKEYPWHITLMVSAANGWKVVQKFTEPKENSNESPTMDSPAS